MRQPRAGTAKGIRRRQEIIEAASSVFAEFGYSGGSIRTIAERVGVSPPTLLQHFGSKAGLLTAVLDDWLYQQRQHAASRGEGRHGLAFFNRMRSVMRYHITHRGLIELFLTMATEASSSTHPARPFIQQRYDTSLDEARIRLREAIADHEIQPMSEAEIDRETRVLFAVMDGLELQWLLDPDHRPRPAVRRLARCHDRSLGWSASVVGLTVAAGPMSGPPQVSPADLSKPATLRCSGW